MSAHVIVSHQPTASFYINHAASASRLSRTCTEALTGRIGGVPVRWSAHSGRPVCIAVPAMSAAACSQYTAQPPASFTGPGCNNQTTFLHGPSRCTPLIAEVLDLFGTCFVSANVPTCCPEVLRAGASWQGWCVSASKQVLGFVPNPLLGGGGQPA